MSNRLLKPKYLSLDDQSKQNAIENIVASNLEEGTKSLSKECLMFIDELEKTLKDPAAKFQEIKKLFDIHTENLKKLNPTQ